MRRTPFVTVDVFTSRRFGGNPLAVFTDARGLSDAEMQALATEMNLSETTFVLPPADPANTARVRIFNPGEEMPFAGHPNVGTAFVLAAAGAAGEVLRFEEGVGLVEVRLQREGGAVVGATVTSPQPLEIGREMAPEMLAPCLGLPAGAVVAATHPPVAAGLGYPFVFAEVAGEAVAAALPDLGAIRRTRDAWAGPSGRLSLFVYAREGARVRARMFAPLVGIPEDPATGSAGATLAALLLARSEAARLELDILQGVEMGRPSELHAAAWRDASGLRGSVGGRCVPVLRGEAAL